MLSRVRAALAVGALAALAACAGGEGEAGQTPEHPAGRPEPLDSALSVHLPPGTTLEMAEEGRRLFVVCAVCHGLDARGTHFASSLRDAEWNTISGELDEIEAVVRSGVRETGDYPIPMPVMGGGDFTQAQLRALVTYVYVISRGDP